MGKNMTDEQAELVKIFKKSQVACETNLCNKCRYNNQEDCKLKRMADYASYFGYGDISGYKARIKQLIDDSYYVEQKYQEKIKDAYDVGYEDGCENTISDIEDVKKVMSEQLVSAKALISSIQKTMKKLTIKERAK